MSFIVLNARELDKMIGFFSTFKDLKEINIHTITVNVVSVPIKYSQSYFGVFWFGVVLGVFLFCFQERLFLKQKGN